LVDSYFEYQIKGKIPRSNNIQYVVHPMCYEHYHCKVGERSMVNPGIYDETELLAMDLIDD